MDYFGFQASCHNIWHYEEMSYSKPWFIYAKMNANNYFQNAKKKKYTQSAKYASIMFMATCALAFSPNFYKTSLSLLPNASPPLS
jgi:hypothetical protein